MEEESSWLAKFDGANRNCTILGGNENRKSLS